MRLMLPGLGLALGFRGARTELVKIHQERESNAEHLGAERITEIEEEEDDVPSEEGGTRDMDSGDDEDGSGDGSEDGSESGEDEDEDEDGYEQNDQEDAKNNDDLGNRGKLQPVSALTIIVPLQEVIEVMRCTVDEEAFLDMPTPGKLKTLAALALAVTARVAAIGFILWGMAQASENDVVLVFYR